MPGPSRSPTSVTSSPSEGPSARGAVCEPEEPEEPEELCARTGVDNMMLQTTAPVTVNAMVERDFRTTISFLDSGHPHIDAGGRAER